MDPVSALGVAATALQLAQEAYSLIKFIKDVYSKAGETPEDGQRELVQVEQLVQLTDLVMKNPSLQREELKRALATCRERAEEFLVVLQGLCVKETSGKRERIKIAFKAVMKEDKLSSMFAKLEQEKSSLVLCIQVIDSSLLSSINISVDDLKKDMGNMAIVLQDTSRDVQTMADSMSGVSAKIDGISTTVTVLRLLPDIAENIRLLKLSAEKEVTRAPSPQPSTRHYNVPNRHVLGFVGRQDILNQIETGFSSDNAPSIVVLRGLGGQGKTQIALQYCRQSKTKFSVTFWVDATSESTLTKGFATISERIKAPSQVLEDAERVQFVIDTFQEWQEPWLMVFDNYDDPESFNNLQDFIPTGELGCILITSRHAAPKDLTDPNNAIDLPCLPKSDSLKLFFKQCQGTETESTISKAEFIVDRLGNHPLAITQAGAYIRTQKIRIEDFNVHYDHQRRTILEQTPRMTSYRKKLGTTEEETAMSVFATWELSFQQLLNSKPRGHQRADILTLFAFFDSKDISEELFPSFCKRKSPNLEESEPGGSLKSSLDAQGQWDSTSFVNNIDFLTDMSLVQSWWRDNDDSFCHLSLHPLVRDWIRLRIGERERSGYSLVAAQILNAFLESRSSRRHYKLTLSTRQALLSHFAAHKDNQQFLPRAGSVSKGFLSDWYDTEDTFFYFLLDSGAYKEAEGLNQLVLEGRGKLLGPDDPNGLISINELASRQAALALRYQRKFSEAERQLRFNLERYGPHFGNDHPRTLKTMSNLASTLRPQGKNDEAEKILRQVLEVFEEHYGREDVNTLIYVNSLATVLRDQAKFDEAEPLLRRSLEGREKKLGLEDRATLVSVWNLGDLLRRQRRFDESLMMFQRAISGYQKLYGKEHPETLRLFEQYSKLVREIDDKLVETKSQPV